MNALHQFAAVRELHDATRGGSSVVLFGPRYFGKRIIVRSFIEEHVAEGNQCCLELSSQSAMGGGEIDFTALWESTRRQLSSRSRVVVNDSSGFIDAVIAAAVAKPEWIRVFLTGCGKGNEERHLNLISVWNTILGEAARKGLNRLTVVALDDYSVYYHQKTARLRSDFAYFEKKIHLPLLSTDEVAGYTRAVLGNKGVSEAKIRKMAEAVCKSTGGHMGLVIDLVHFLCDVAAEVPEPEWKEQLTKRVSGSYILEGIGKVLEEDLEGLTCTALEYTVATVPEANSPRVEVLREAGVIIRDRPSSRLKLCPGAITTLVNEQSQPNSARPKRIGTLVTEAGPRVFQNENLAITQDDFVVVHLSDLHCSEDQYRYRLTYGGRSINRGEASLADMISADLASMELLGRVDAMVVSGDFVERGKAEEYDLAEEVLRDVCERMGLQLGQVVVLPGNHDVDWKPGLGALVDRCTAVSKDGYVRFRKLLGKNALTDVEFLNLKSRSGLRTLRILGFDSNLVEGPSAPGIGYISREAFETARKTLEQADQKDGGGGYTWLAVHHHVFPASSMRIKDASDRKVSLLGNSAEIQYYAVKWNADIILHGHEHQPLVMVARTWPLEGGLDFRPLVVAGAGSVAARDLGPFGRNHYQVIIRRTSDIVIRSRCIGQNGIHFGTHNDLIVPAASRG